MEKQERTKTISKSYYDDEVIGRLENGDLYLQMGVKRKHYDKSDNDLGSKYLEVDYEDTRLGLKPISFPVSGSGEYINTYLLEIDKNKESMKKYKDTDLNEGEIDNWETD